MVGAVRRKLPPRPSQTRWHARSRDADTAAVVRESMTVIATNSPPRPPELSALVDWIFTRIGRVVHFRPL